MTSTFSLQDLKPKVIEVVIKGYGDDIVIPILPLTYVQWNNALVGVDIPTPPTIRTMKDGKAQNVQDFNDTDYQQRLADANTTVNLRRLAIALAGGGAEELQNKPLDEQIELLRDMDTGTTNALIELLSRMARNKRAERFQKQSLSENDNGRMQSPSLDSEPVLELS